MLKGEVSKLVPQSFMHHSVYMYTTIGTHSYHKTLFVSKKLINCDPVCEKWSYSLTDCTCLAMHKKTYSCFRIAKHSYVYITLQTQYKTVVLLFHIIISTFSWPEDISKSHGLNFHGINMSWTHHGFSLKFHEKIIGISYGSFLVTH